MNKCVWPLTIAMLLATAAPSSSGQGWQELVELSKSLARDHNLDSAVTVLTTALRNVEAEFGPHDTTTGKVLYRIGVYQSRAGDYSQAQSNLSKALRVFELNLGTEHSYVGRTLNNLALACKQLGEYQQAEKLYLRSLKNKEEALGPDHLDIAKSLSNLGVLYTTQARYAEAEPCLVRALEILQKTPGSNELTLAKWTSSLGDLYRITGRYSEAETLLHRAVSILEELYPEHPYLADALTRLANVYCEYGSYREAEPLYQRAVAICEKAGSPLLPYGLHDLALNYYYQGDFIRAEPLLKRAVKITERTLGTNHPDLARSLKLLADLFVALGKHDEADIYFHRALMISENALGPEHPDVALVMSNLAWLYLQQGRYADAEPLLARSLMIYEISKGPEHRLVAYALESLAEVYVAQGRYALAEKLLARAISIVEKGFGSEHPSLTYFLTCQADISRRQGKHRQAESMHERALAVGLKVLGLNHPQVARCLELSSPFYRLIGANDKALETSRMAFDIRRSNLTRNGTVLSEQDALKYSRLMRQSADNYLSCYLDSRPKDDSQAVRASDVVLASKGQVSDAIYDRRRSQVAENDSATLVLAEAYRRARFEIAKRYVSGPGEINSEEFADELDSLSNLANDLEADLARLSASFKRNQDHQHVSIQRIAALLPDNSILVEYLKYNYLSLNPDTAVSQYLAVTIDNTGKTVTIDLGDASHIDNLVHRYRAHFLDLAASGGLPTVVDRMEHQEIAGALYDRVWMPLKNHVTGKQMVLIAPDGGLNMVSFAGLVDQDGHYLIEKNTVHYLAAARDLLRLQDQFQPGSGLFALGDPDYDAPAAARLSPAAPATPGATPDTGGNQLRYVRSGQGRLANLTVNPLPGSRKEIQRITSLWPQLYDEPVTVYYGPEASEEIFKISAPGHRVIHLATHGYFLEGVRQSPMLERGFGSDVSYVGENPLLLSGLLLAGANLHGEGADREGAEDGILTAYEVSELALDGTELVVLSACETGLGEVKEGEGVYGLRRAFQMAGVRTVISSLWPVSDELTADMMARLFSRTNVPLPELMRHMQQRRIEELRAQGKPDHPFTWAAFIAQGDWM